MPCGRGGGAHAAQGRALCRTGATAALGIGTGPAGVARSVHTAAIPCVRSPMAGMVMCIRPLSVREIVFVGAHRLPGAVGSQSVVLAI